MKHIKHVTKGTPVSATAFEDIFCAVTSVVVAILGSFGGAAPILDYLEDKCTPELP